MALDIGNFRDRTWFQGSSSPVNFGKDLPNELLNPLSDALRAVENRPSNESMTNQFDHVVKALKHLAPSLQELISDSAQYGQAKYKNGNYQVSISNDKGSKQISISVSDELRHLSFALNEEAQFVGDIRYSKSEPQKPLRSQGLVDRYEAFVKRAEKATTFAVNDNDARSELITRLHSSLSV
ncbi:MAG: hypothetical protein LW817_05285 [Candidatus Caenarcaniphilales bacterium]|jgi:hypothetical protein|nr:hypothetical protein [Candidatus Caenarcaniphilales bacterium]